MRPSPASLPVQRPRLRGLPRPSPLLLASQATRGDSLHTKPERAPGPVSLETGASYHSRLSQHSTLQTPRSLYLRATGGRQIRTPRASHSGAGKGLFPSSRPEEGHQTGGGGAQQTSPSPRRPSGASKGRECANRPSPPDWPQEPSWTPPSSRAWPAPTYVGIHAHI